MKHRTFKNRIRTKINLRKVENLDFFEEVPPSKAYKLRRAVHRNLRRLKPANPVGAKFQQNTPHTRHNLI